MTTQKQKHNYCIVGFRYDTEHSVGYFKINHPDNVAQVVKILLTTRNADVISIRRVYPCQPQPNQPTS